MSAVVAAPAGGEGRVLYNHTGIETTDQTAGPCETQFVPAAIGVDGPQSRCDAYRSGIDAT